VGDGSGSAGFGTGGTYGGGQALDLSDLFVANTVPGGLPTLRVSASGYTVNNRAHTAVQTVTVTNTLGSAISSPVYLALGNLNTTLSNSAGATANTAPGSPYVEVSAGGLGAGSSATFVLQFALPGGGAAIYDNLVPFTTSGTP
jgi:hypothetical protein